MLTDVDVYIFLYFFLFFFILYFFIITNSTPRRKEITLDYVLFKMIMQREKEVWKTLWKNRGSNREAKSIRLRWSRNMDVAADRLVKQHDAVRIVRHIQADLIGRTA